MKILLVLALILHTSVSAQLLKFPPNPNTPKATISETIGVTNITLAYSRPGVKNREGKIWGSVVKYGFTNSSFMGPANFSPTGAPWRAGANENTTITTEHDIMFEGKLLPAGRYGLHMAVWPDSCVVILTSLNTAWGSFYYDPKNDILRTTVIPQKINESVERLKFEFSDQTDSTAIVSLLWEKLKIPIKLKVDVVGNVINNLRKQLYSADGFEYPSWTRAADYCLRNNRNLTEALEWSERGIGGFGGQRTFLSYIVKANILYKLSREVEADSTVFQAIQYGDAGQMQSTIGTFIKRKKFESAQRIIQAAEKKYGDVHAVLVGYMRIYSGMGEYAKALEYAKAALKKTTTEAVKKSIEDAIRKLEENKDINQ